MDALIRDRATVLGTHTRHLDVVLREYVQHSTRTARTDHSINAHPRAALRDVLTQPSGRYDETGSAASSTNTCRSHEVAEFSAPTRSVRGCVTGFSTTALCSVRSTEVVGLPCAS
jgi:hypothetical protein